MNKYYRVSVFTVGFLLLEIICYFYVDRPTAQFMRELDTTNPDIVNFFRTITDAGKSIWYLVPCGIATLFCAFLSRGKDVPTSYRRLFGYVGIRAMFLFITIGVSGVVVNIIKPIVGRARPIMFLRDQIYGVSPLTTQGSLWNSMPSGHTATAFALACSLALLFPRGRIVWFAFGLMLAASRVIVDAHYVSDVCAGAALGWLTTKLFYQYGMFRLSRVIFPIDSVLPKA